MAEKNLMGLSFSVEFLVLLSKSCHIIGMVLYGIVPSIHIITMAFTYILYSGRQPLCRFRRIIQFFCKLTNHGVGHLIIYMFFVYEE